MIFEVFERARWPTISFVCIAVITVPLYIVVVAGILHGIRRSSRFRTVYYYLVLSQAIVDAVAIPSDSFTFVCRYMGLFKDLFWEKRYYLAPYSFNSNHLLFMLRVFGDFLVSLQRFLILCYPFSSLQKFVSSLPFGVIVLIHWTVPILISLPITLNFDRAFDTPDTLLTVVKTADQMVASSLEVIYQLTIFSISVTAYLFVFKIILSHRLDGGLTREMRLSLVVMGQTVAFGLSVAFYSTQYVVVKLDITDAILQLRNYYPLLTGFESFVNPWLHIIVNTDLRKEVWRMFGMRKDSSTGVSDSQSRPMNRVATAETG